MLQNDYTYSIIIPHKNCSSLLQRCLDSIPYREDVQVIVVDDNSDEEKVDFSKFPGLDTPNVEVYFTKEGKGAGYARNVGLKYVRGKWLMFVDADDFLAIGFLDILDDYKDSLYDIVFMGATSIYPKTGEVASRHIHYNQCLQEAILNNNYSFLRYKSASPVSKLVKRSLVKKRHIWFDEVHAANDILFSLKTGYFAHSVKADNRVVYIITVQSGSLEYTISERILLCRIEADKRVEKFYKEHGIKEYICVMRYIIPLRKVSMIKFLQYIVPYLFSSPIQAIKDYAYLRHLKVQNLKNSSSQEYKKSMSFMKIER